MANSKRRVLIDYEVTGAMNVDIKNNPACAFFVRAIYLLLSNPY